MVNFCAVCGCCTRTDIVREHLENTLRICDVSAMGLYAVFYKIISSHCEFFQINSPKHHRFSPGIPVSFCSSTGPSPGPFTLRETLRANTGIQCKIKLV